MPRHIKVFKNATLILHKCNYNMMSFSGHPVCHLGLDWCILLGLFIFPALAKGSCCLLFPLGNKIRVIIYSNVKIPMHLKNQILQNVCPKGIMGKLFGIFRGHYMVFFVFLSTKYIFCYYCLFFFLFQIKTSGFHLKEEGKELLGMLMTALANNNGYYVLYLFPLFFSN